MFGSWQGTVVVGTLLNHRCCFLPFLMKFVCCSLLISGFLAGKLLLSDGYVAIHQENLPNAGSGRWEW